MADPNPIDPTYPPIKPPEPTQAPSDGGGSGQPNPPPPTRP